MNISWNGFGSFTFTAKPLDGEVDLVTDPYQNTTGLRFPRTLKASLLVQSHDSDYANNTSAVSAESESPMFTVTHAGEYEVRGMFAKGITAPIKNDPNHTIYRLYVEGIKIGFLGALDRKLSESEVEALGDIDVLIVPVGGGRVMNAQEAADVVNQVEPRIVIPSYGKVEGSKETLADVKVFSDEVGCVSEEVNKAKITESSLPQEDMQMFILSRS